MPEENISRTSSQLNPGYAHDADSPIMGGMKSAQTGAVSNRNLYESEQYSDGKGRMRHGSPIFYALLEKMAVVHDKKSHDYASNDNPFGNYHFAGQMSQLFTDYRDAGFVGRIGEKLYRLANLENNGLKALNESIEDTEEDLCVIMTLWVADRRKRRMSENAKSATPISRY